MFAVTIMLETQRSLTKEPCTATSWLTSNVAASLSPMQIHLVPGQTEYPGMWARKSLALGRLFISDHKTHTDQLMSCLGSVMVRALQDAQANKP